MIGWVLHPDHLGHGYATEAVGEVLRVCFDELALRRVVAGCFAANVVSWRLMERIGMRREQHTVRDACCTDPASGWTVTATPFSPRSGEHEPISKGPLIGTVPAVSSPERGLNTGFPAFHP